MPKTSDAAPSFAGQDQDGKIVHVKNAGNADIHFNEMKDAIAGLKGVKSTNRLSSETPAGRKFAACNRG